MCARLSLCGECARARRLGHTRAFSSQAHAFEYAQAAHFGMQARGRKCKWQGNVPMMHRITCIADAGAETLLINSCQKNENLTVEFEEKSCLQDLQQGTQERGLLVGIAELGAFLSNACNPLHDTAEVILHSFPCPLSPNPSSARMLPGEYRGRKKSGAARQPRALKASPRGRWRRGGHR